MPQGSVHGVAKSQTWLSDWTTIARICYVGLFLSVEMTTPSFARTCNYNHFNNACQPSVANLVFPSSANFLYNKCQAALDNQQIADNAHCCITLTLPRPLFAASDLWPHREPRCNKATTVIRVRIHVIFLALVETVKIPFIFNYYLFGPFLQRARGCLISQAEPQESVLAGKNASFAYQELEDWAMGQRGHDPSGAGDGEASGPCLSDGHFPRELLEKWHAWKVPGYVKFSYREEN